MKQRARRLKVSRSIERKPVPGGGHPFVKIRRYVAARRAMQPGLRGRPTPPLEIGHHEGFSFYESVRF